MTILRFTLQIFQLNITLNLFHIQTQLLSNQLMIIKWTISCNYYTQNMMIIFWMLTSRCVRLDWWLLILHNCIHSILCCFRNMEKQMLQSQISCHTFLCLSQPRALWNWLMETSYMTKELGLFYVTFLNVPLFIHLYQFIIVQVTLPTLSYQAPSNLCWFSKGYIWTSWTLWFCWTSR